MKKLFFFFLKTVSYRFAFQKAKKQGVLLYLKALQVARKSLLAAFILYFMLQLMVFGFIGAAVSGVWLLPLENSETRLWILLSFFLFLFLIPLIILIISFSEKMWLKASGADKLLHLENDMNE